MIARPYAHAGLATRGVKVGASGGQEKPNRAEIIVCVAVGERQVAVRSPRVPRASARITVAHIWRPESLNMHSERAFAEGFVNDKKRQNGSARKHYACAYLVSIDSQENVSACVC